MYDSLRELCRLSRYRGEGGALLGDGSRIDQQSLHIKNVTKWPSPLCQGPHHVGNAEFIAPSCGGKWPGRFHLEA